MDGFSMLTPLIYNDGIQLVSGTDLLFLSMIFIMSLCIVLSCPEPGL